MAVQPEVTAGGSHQRVLVLALAGVLLLLLAVLLVRPLLRGGTQTPAGGPPVTAGPTPTTGAQLIDPSTSVAGPTAPAKDPFRPLAGAAGSETTGVTATTAGSTTSTTASITGSATVSGSSATAEREVVLQDVYSQSGTRYVKVAVDGTSYTATEGQRFAAGYRVLDIGGACATFESGVTRSPSARTRRPSTSGPRPAVQLASAGCCAT
jgi:hypothetical protein